MSEATKNQIAQVIATALQSDISQHFASQQVNVMVNEDNSFIIHLTNLGSDDLMALDNILHNYGRCLSSWSINPGDDPQTITLLIFTERNN